MKLVYFDFTIHFGGAQRATVFLCEELKSSNDIVVIDAYGACPPYLQALGEKKLQTKILLPNAAKTFVGCSGKPVKRLLSLTSQLPDLLKLRSRLVEEISRVEPDLILTTEAKPLLFLGSSRRLRKYPVAFFARGWYQRYQLTWWKRWLIKHRADCVLAVSTATATAMASWGVPKDNIFVVFDALHYQRLLKDSSEPPSGPLPKQNSSFKILMPGQLLPTKGQATAILAASLLRDKNIDFVLWIAGRVSAADKSGYSDFLRELIRRHHLERNVCLLGQRTDIPALIRLADIVVLPTHTEGLPRVILEAMALKRTIISTPVGGVTDLIEHGETGLITPVGDAEALAENMRKLLGDKRLADRIRQRAYRLVMEKFSLTNHIKLVESAFQQVL